VLEGLLRQHARDRTLIFTNDNDTVYAIARRFLIPALTHQTDVKERREVLERFNSGSTPRWSRRGCSTRGSTSPRPTWPSC
jgi:superfamily II DNA or RNA helicase